MKLTTNGKVKVKTFSQAKYIISYLERKGYTKRWAINNIRADFLGEQEAYVYWEEKNIWCTTYRVDYKEYPFSYFLPKEEVGGDLF